MNKKLVVISILGIVSILGLVFTKTVQKNKPANSGQETAIRAQDNEAGMNQAILYYGITCPHCKVVEEWLDENPKVREKSGLIDKEVYQNKQNSQEMVDKANECKIDSRNGVGVPFLYANGQCVIGDQPIINYLKENYQ